MKINKNTFAGLLLILMIFFSKPSFSQNSGLDIFIHDENGKGVTDKLNVSYKLKGKQITKTLLTGENGILEVCIPDKTEVTVIFDNPLYFKHKVSVIAPSKVNILRTNIEAYSQFLNKEILLFVKNSGYGNTDIKILSEAKINLISEKSAASFEFSKNSININCNKFKSTDDLNLFIKKYTFETGLYIFNNIIYPEEDFSIDLFMRDEYEYKEHNISLLSPYKIMEIAFKDAFADFFSYLFISSLKDNVYAKSADSVKETTEPVLLSRSGNYSSLNILRFFLSYYEYKLNSPESVFKDLSNTIRIYKDFYTSLRPALTIEEFIDSKLNSGSPGLVYAGNIKHLAHDLNIKTSNKWQIIYVKAEDLKNIDITRLNKKIKYAPDIMIENGDQLEISADNKIAFQRFTENWLVKGEKEWILPGPVVNNFYVNINNGNFQLTKGISQFVSASTKTANDLDTIISENANYLIEADEKKQTTISVLNGAVLVKELSSGEQIKIPENIMVIISSDNNVEGPYRVESKGKNNWWRVSNHPVIGQYILLSPTADGSIIRSDDGSKLTAVKSETYYIFVPENWVLKEKKKYTEFEIRSQDGKKTILFFEISLKPADVSSDALEKFIRSWDEKYVGPGKLYTSKISMKDIDFKGYPAYEAEYGFLSDGVESISKVLFFRRNNKIHIVECLTPASEYMENSEIFNKVTKSLIINKSN